MKKARFTEEQMVAILRVPDRDPIVDIAEKHKIDVCHRAAANRQNARLRIAGKHSCQWCSNSPKALKLRGAERIAEIIRGVQFKNGVSMEAKTGQMIAA